MTIIQTNTVSKDILDAVNGNRNSSSSSVDEAQNRFMTLLIEQMKNQDPLNPMDNAQVTSQMAQLSTVTGINKLNETLEGLINNVQSAQTYQAANLIGRNVLVSGNQIMMQGSTGVFGVNLPVGADGMTVNIKDGAGNVVRTLEYGAQSAGSLPLTWDGLTNDGTPAASGTYQFDVTAKVSGQNVIASALSFAQVLSVSNANGNVKLNLSDASSVSASEILEVF